MLPRFQRAHVELILVKNTVLKRLKLSSQAVVT